MSSNHVIAPTATCPKPITDFPYPTEEIENLWIPLPDGCRLAARVWMPTDATQHPQPAIVEYLPYRKRDGTAVRDELTHPYFAGHGYVCVRVDMRGNGDSDGLMLDEYVRQEQEDALAIIDWLVEQPWCDGNIGMMGISWGGFNALQVAALRPPALKAIISLCSTDDRYADDIHYKGGALLLENAGWASTMFSYCSRPPDPAIVGKRWRDMWLHRLSHIPLLLEGWLAHAHRDEFWKHGSICENYGSITAATLLVGGWGDAYHNTIPRMLAELTAPRRGITGPWYHKYPHIAAPGPAIGFLQEALRWWDQWLKGQETGVMEDPLYRAYLMDSVRPQSSYPHREGRWVGEDQWPSAAIEDETFGLGASVLHRGASDDVTLTVSSPLDTGTAGGEYCAIWLGPEGPTDQREDDAGSLVFDTAPLIDTMPIFGAACVTLTITSNEPVAQLAVRLCDVWPDGASTRITYGVLNLCHRDSHEQPSALEVGKRYVVRVPLDDIAYAVPLGHRLRLSISTAYWPLLWPTPKPATLTIECKSSALTIPIRVETEPQREPVFPPPESAQPLSLTEHRPSANTRRVTKDRASGYTTVEIVDDFGEHTIDHLGLRTSEMARETYRVAPFDGSSSEATFHWTETLARPGWSIRTETRTRLTCDEHDFFIDAEIDAYHNDIRIFSRNWHRSVPRRLV